MKTCPNCNAQIEDNAAFCTSCGTRFASEPAAAPEQPAAPAAPAVPAVDPYDHTAEFDAKDISENKVIAMLVYLLGIIGVFIALIVGKSSPYAAFHVRQALKFTVLEAILAICAVVLIWTIVVPAAAGICSMILLVLKVIAFFQICSGKAKEPAIVREFSFLK